MNQEEKREFYKSLQERIKQLRIYDGILDDSTMMTKNQMSL